jgi:hypothetical protein
VLASGVFLHVLLDVEKIAGVVEEREAGDSGLGVAGFGGGIGAAGVVDAIAGKVEVKAGLILLTELTERVAEAAGDKDGRVKRAGLVGMAVDLGWREALVHFAFGVGLDAEVAGGLNLPLHFAFANLLAGKGFAAGEGGEFVLEGFGGHAQGAEASAQGVVLSLRQACGQECAADYDETPHPPFHCLSFDRRRGVLRSRFMGRPGEGGSGR